MFEKSCLLIVDDDARGRQTLEVLLSAEGYDLRFAENGEGALSQARQATPDLMLLDVMMPGMDGFEVCRRVREDPLLAEMPVILLTALDDRESRLHGIEAGADDYISKPFDRIELRARVRTITRLNRYRRLTAERGKFAWVVEESDDGYVLLDKAGKVAYANPRARFFLHLPDTGEPQEENFLAQAKRHYQLEPPDAWEHWPGGESLAGPCYLVRPETPEQRALWLQVNGFASPVSPGDGGLIRLRDVTAQMNLQQQAWTFQRLVSHKLRTPLMGLTALQLAKRQIAPVLDEKSMQLFEMAEHNVQRLHQQIMDILRYVDAPSLLQSGAAIDPPRLRALVAELGRCQQVPVALSIPEDFGEVLAISDDAFKCILEELLSNAKKFHPRQQPQVELSVERLQDDGVLLRLRDDGRHLSPEELRKVWLPYYQAEKKFTGEVKGMGLGLSTVASLIWRVGGDCRLCNRSDRPGVVVELYLPLQQAD